MKISTLNHRSAVRLLAAASFVLVMFRAFGPGSLEAVAQAASSQSASAVTTELLRLDNVDLVIRSDALPSGTFVISEPGASSQVATSTSWSPFRELSITAIPFGRKPGTESLPPAATGAAAAYQAALRAYRLQQGAKVDPGPVATLFGKSISATQSLVMLYIDGPTQEPVIIDEWVVEAGGRLWIVRASREQAPGGLSWQSIPFAADLTVESDTLDRPSSIGSVPDQRRTQAASPNATASDLPAPSWWNGDCDLTTYQQSSSNPKHIASYRLGAVYLGMPACGPRPWADGAPDVLVRFFPGAWGVYEWECVELTMRFLYLMYGINPYQANGSQVVWNYSGTLLTKVPNGTIGQAPQPNDVLSYGATSTFGHAAIVAASSVDTNGNGTITVIEENASPSGNSTLSVSNWWVSGNAGSVSGWLHVNDGVGGSAPWYGSVSITSDRPVVAVARSHTGSEVATYDSFASGGLSSYLPMLFKNAWGSYDSAFYVQDAHATNTAHITINYYDTNGNLTCGPIQDTISPLSSHGYWVPGIGCLPDGWAGGAVVTSDQPIVTVGRPHVGVEIMTYNGFASGSLASYLPMLFKNAWGSYDSAFYVQDANAANTAHVTLRYYDVSGNPTCEVMDTIAPLSSKGYWLPSVGCLPDGWVGGVTVTSDQPIVTVGRIHVGSQVTTYDGFPTGSLIASTPMLFKNVDGIDSSALYVQDVDSTHVAAITIKYYATNGQLTCAVLDAIAPLSSNGYWLPNLTCLPDGWTGTAVVSSDQPVVAVGRAHMGSQVTTYDGFASGSAAANLPMLFKNMWGSYNSAFYIQNTDEGGPASVTLKFYDVNGNLSCQRTDSIPIMASLSYWVPSVECAP